MKPHPPQQPPPVQYANVPNNVQDLHQPQFHAHPANSSYFYGVHNAAQYGSSSYFQNPQNHQPPPPLQPPPNYHNSGGNIYPAGALLDNQYNVPTQSNGMRDLSGDAYGHRLAHYKPPPPQQPPPITYQGPDNYGNYPYLNISAVHLPRPNTVQSRNAALNVPANDQHRGVSTTYEIQESSENIA